jgi:PHP family Zn ribbon phosphoesterase
VNISNIIEGFSKHLLNEFGLKEAPQFSKDRLDECNKCEKRVSNPFNDSEKEKKWCGQCGCFIPAKVLVKTEHCPIYKWQSYGSSKYNRTTDSNG